MNRIIAALVLSLAAAFCHAGELLQLAENAPARYTVMRGDTLWDISGKFLKEPWRWPEIWRMNREEIRNPHRIYPGDALVLERDADGRPLLRRIAGDRLRPQIHSEQIDQAIPPIPPNVIEPFISAPLIVEPDGLNSAPRIVATAQDRVFVGNGDVVYVENADPETRQWQVYRNGQPLLDPDDSRQVLGYEAFYLGTATQTRVGNPATFEIRMAKQEIGRGDRLTPALRPPLIDYIPHRPDVEIDGKIITMYGGVRVGGRGSIISLNRGTRDGLEIGHVLALERNRAVTGRDEADRKSMVVIPSERIGLAFVFRTFERISYALIVRSEGTVESNDFVRTP